MLAQMMHKLVFAMMLLTLVALAMDYVGDYVLSCQKEQLRIKNPARFKPYLPVGKRFRAE